MPKTPDSRIRSTLRSLFLRSKERAEVLKRCGYTCVQCGKKQSVAKGREVKVEVHHRSGIDWAGLFDDIRRRLLNADDMEVLCKDCHRREHGKAG